MFSVFESFFRASLEREERPPGIANVGVFTLRRLLYDCSARACGPDEPGGDPRGPGGEAQWPGGGYMAWTERATKSPAWVKGYGFKAVKGRFSYNTYPIAPWLSTHSYVLAVLHPR